MGYRNIRITCGSKVKKNISYAPIIKKKCTPNFSSIVKYLVIDECIAEVDGSQRRLRSGSEPNIFIGQYAAIIGGLKYLVYHNTIQVLLRWAAVASRSRRKEVVH